MKKIILLLMIFVSTLAAKVWASHINTISVSFVNGTDKVFTAGVTTNTTNSGQIWLATTPAPHSTGTIRLELIENGQVVSGGVSPSSFTDIGSSPLGLVSNVFPQLELPIVFLHAGTSLQLRAIIDDTGISATSETFDVNPGPPARLVIVAPGMTYAPGPGTSTGRTGTATSHEPFEAFSVTVHLTDNWFNQLTDNHTVSFTSGNLIQLPSPGALTSGVGNFTVVVTGAKTTRTITVTDDDDATVITGTVDVTTSGPAAEEVFPFPSPFNPKIGQSMTFRFRLTSASNVKLKVFNLFGQGVWERSVAAGAGTTDIGWDGKNEKGITVASGVYYIMLEIDGSIKSKKRFGIIK